MSGSNASAIVERELRAPWEQASFVLWAFGLLCLALLAVGGTPARLLIPAGATVTAYLLYRHAQPQYVTFVWWLWFLIPFARRIVDYRSGFVDGSPILATPYLATLVCIPSLLDVKWSEWTRGSRLPFLLAFVGTFYGFALGVLFIPKKLLLVSALGWFAPLVFGFFASNEIVHGEHRDEMLDSLSNAFLWALLGMSVYGLAQYALLPAWDRYWMDQTQNVFPGLGSIGEAEPFAFRVFSTMNGPGAFAFTVVPGILLATRRRGPLGWIALSLGCAALLLSSVRSAWIALAVGVVCLVSRQRKYLKNVVLGVVLLTVCVMGAMLVDPIRETLQNRFLSFTNLSDDTSFQDRSSGSERMAGYLVDSPFGTGLGSMDAIYASKSALGTRDSGLWEIMLSLGWVAGAVYLASLGLLVWNVLRSGIPRSSLEIVMASIVVALVSQIFLGSVMLGVTGCAIWLFAGIAMAPIDRVSPALARGAHGE